MRRRRRSITNSKVFKSQAANPKGKPHARRAQRLTQEMTMEDRRAEAIRQVHEQEAMMQRNTVAVRWKRERAIKLGYWASP